jgi:uncharacterized Zn finger protein
MGRGYWGGFAPYVSKAEKMRLADKAKAALAKKGVKLEPVAVNGGGREIARTWWGKSWAQNLERYADYSNRVPRGRSYVRNGSVLDLQIAENKISALVAGSRPKPYKIEIGIKSLEEKSEKKLMERSRASLDSMQALLSGEFPAELKEEFFKQGTGLFPSPKEIQLDCSCPDWADMCKHVAAALYGTAVRLDEKPELFFTLRGMKVHDFVGKMVKRESRDILQKAKQKSARAIVSDKDEVSALFGITMESESPEATGTSVAKKRRTAAAADKKITAKAGSRKRVSAAEKKPGKNKPKKAKPRRG